jgi:hypothetical protein
MLRRQRGVRWALAIGTIGAAIAVGGCGGADTDVAASSSRGAQFAPETTAAFIELDTNVSGAQWRLSDQLLAKFPGRDDLLAALDGEPGGLSWEQDVRPALGDALYVAYLDLQHEGDDAVGYTKPADAMRFARLLDRHDPPLVHRELDGWTVFAESNALIDRFEEERSNGSLADDDAFRESFDRLPEDAVARTFLSGRDVQRAFDHSLADTGADALTQGFGKLQSISAALTAQENGVGLTADVAAEGAPKAHAYTPELPGTVPSGALVYISFGDVRELLERGLDSFGKRATGLAQLGTILGSAIQDDALSLFGQEGGLAVYRGAASTPRYALFLRVDDERGARELIDGLGGLAQLGGQATTRTFTLEGAEVREFTFRKQELTVYATVSDGHVIVTNSERVLRDALDGGPSLADDNAFKDARAAADVPDEVTSLAYVDVPGAVRAYYHAEGETMPRDVRENIEPLRSAILYGEGDGDHRTIKGLLEVR